DMKVFCSILTIYIMAVFLTPCADRYQKETFQSYSHSEELAHQDSHDHSKTTDMCGPFWLCNCCGAVITVLPWNTINFSEIRIVELSKSNSPYISQFIPHYFGKIWQPPKINA